MAKPKAQGQAITMVAIAANKAREMIPAFKFSQGRKGVNRESINYMLNQIKTKQLIKESLKNGDSNEEINESDEENYLNEENLLNLDE